MGTRIEATGTRLLLAFDTLVKSPSRAVSYLGPAVGLLLPALLLALLALPAPLHAQTAPPVTITKTDGGQPVIAGTTLVYTITVNNPAGGERAIIRVSDPVPAGVDWCVWHGGFTNAFISGSNQDLPQAMDLVNWRIGLLDGGSATIVGYCLVSANTTGVITNTATVTQTDYSDLNPQVHSASVQTQIVAPTPQVIYVDKDRAAGGDGASWATAYNYLQDALAAAEPYDEIWIAEGIYLPDEGNGLTNDDPALSFQLKEAVSLYGGFQGNETARSDADPETYVTVLSGDVDQNDTRDINGVTQSYTQIAGTNSYHVADCAMQLAPITLDGLAVTAGSASVFQENFAGGGGIRSISCHLKLRRVQVVGNQSTAFAGSGGGIVVDQAEVYPPGKSYEEFLSTGTLVVEESRIAANKATSLGGGMSIDLGDSVEKELGVTPFSLSASVVADNVSFDTVQGDCVFPVEGGGGLALKIFGMPAVIEDTNFRHNEAWCGGGAIWMDRVSLLTVKRSVFEENRGTTPSYSRLNPGSNLGIGDGGAFFVEESDLRIESTLFAGNEASGYGGAIAAVPSVKDHVTLVNVTMTGNHSDLQGGAIIAAYTGSTPNPTDKYFKVFNSIIYGNRGKSAATDNIFSDPPTISGYGHSLIEGSNGSGASWNTSLGADLGGNIDVVPGFRNIVPDDPAASDYRLNLGSPAIDAGDNAAVVDPLDLDRQPRIFNGTVDMGAYESHIICPPSATTRLYVNSTATGASTGVSWADALPILQNALAMASVCPSNSISEVWVAQGTYYPDDGDYQVAGDRAAAFRLKSGLSIYGGFLGSESSLGQRNPWSYITTLSGDIGQDDHTDANDLVETPADIVGANSYHVVVASGTNSTARLDGFAVTGGQANGSPAARQHEGGALFAETGSPTLNNLALVGNIAEEGGAMTLVSGSNPIIADAWFGGNAAGDYGGALHNESSNPTLINVQMSGNRAVSGGGAIYNLASSPVLINVTIAGNAAGGTVSVASVSPAAVMIAPAGGGILNLTGSKPDIRNSIVWANQDSTGIGTGSASIRNLDVGSTPSADYSDIQGLTTISGLIYDGTSMDADPLFVTPVDPATAPAFTPALKLNALSPVIDKGNNAFNTLPTDLAGMTRIQGAAIDMGAFETTPAPHIALHKSASTPVAKVGETITYTYQVVNTGLVTLTALSATDDKLGVVNFGVSQLAPSASATASLAYTVVEGDLPGPLTNRAAVTGTSSLSGTVVATEAASVGLSYRPRLVVTVTPSALSALPGTTVTYAVQVKNTGDVSLSSVAAADNRLGAVTLNATTLAPGATASGTIAYTVQTSDLPGPLVDTVTGSGTSPLSTQVKGTDSTTVAVIDPNPPPAFDLYMPTIAKQ